jgi:hypothetical protein
VATLGLRPFGRGPAAMPKILRGQYRKPRQLLDSYPKELEAIIIKALNDDPAGRFQTAEEMRLALEQWLTSSGYVLTPSDIARVVRRRLNPERRQTIEALRHTNKPLLVALAERGQRELSQDEPTLTPTASSGMVVRPDELSHSSSGAPPPSMVAESAGDDSTVIDPVGPGEDPIAVRRSLGPTAAADTDPIGIPAASAPLPGVVESDLRAQEGRALSRPTEIADEPACADWATAPTIRPVARPAAPDPAPKDTTSTVTRSRGHSLVHLLLAALAALVLAALLALTR